MRLILATVAACLLATAPAHACSCAYGSPGERLREAQAAFIGTIVSVRDKEVDGYPSRVLDVRVDEQLKGRLPERIEMTTGQGGGDCGLVEPRAGQRIAQYVFRNRPPYEASICADEDPAVMRRAARPFPPISSTQVPRVVIGGALGADATLAALDARLRPVAVLRTGAVVSAVAVCPGARRVAVLRGDRIEVRRLPDLGAVRFVGRARDAYGVGCLDAAGRHVPAVRSGVLAGRFLVQGAGARVRVRDFVTDRVRTIRARPGDLLAGSPDGRLVAGTRGILDLRTGRLHRRAIGGPATFVSAGRVLLPFSRLLLDQRARVVRRLAAVGFPGLLSGPALVSGDRLRVFAGTRAQDLGRLPAVPRAVALCPRRA